MTKERLGLLRKKLSKLGTKKLLLFSGLTILVVAVVSWMIVSSLMLLHTRREVVAIKSVNSSINGDISDDNQQLSNAESLIGSLNKQIEDAQNATSATSTTSTPTSQPSATNSQTLAQKMNSWSVDYDLQGALELVQNDVTAVENEQSMNLTTDLASDCQQLGTDATTMLNMTASPDPTVTQDIRNGASSLISYSQGSCNDISLANQGMADFTSAISAQGKDEGI